MSTTTISIDGVDKIIEQLDKVAKGDNLEEAVGQGCAVIESAAKQKAPKDTGALRRSIESRVEKTDGAVKGVVFTPLEYAPYVEYGTGLYAVNGGRKDVPWWYKDEEGHWHFTSGQKPHPFLRPALLENREKVLSTIKRGVGK